MSTVNDQDNLAELYPDEQSPLQDIQQDTQDDIDNESNTSDAEEETTNLCIACRQREKDKSDNPHSELCTECRHALIKYPIPKWIFLIFVLIVILLAASVKNIPESIKDLKAYQDAEAKYYDKYYYDSLVLYDELYQKYPDSVLLAVKLMQACIKQQNFDYAAYIIDNSLVGKEVDDSDYKLITESIDLLDRYYSLVSKVDEIITELQSDPVHLSDPGYLYEQINLLDEEEYDKALKLFYLAMLEDKPEDAVDLLQQAYYAEPRFTFLLGYLGNAQRSIGMKDEALATYEKALEHNKTDHLAIRGIGILELLSGNKEKGLELVQKAFEIAPFDTYVSEAMVIALCENGKREEAEQLIEDYLQNEYIFNEELYSYLNGSITLEEYFTYQGGE
ncbi:MAG TPA: hypothetical protein GX505_01640 [Clostridiales bacterium]|nr:hypothetical protein [Clostridiales bacterium]